jgi:hypothetical protein
MIEKQYIDSKGYAYVLLRDKHNKVQVKYVHKLVAEAFVPNPNNLPNVRHKDGNKLNNMADNLEWCE